MTRLVTSRNQARSQFSTFFPFVQNRELKISCPSVSACGTSSYVSNCCSFVTSFSRASCRIDLDTHPKLIDHIVSGSGSCKSSAIQLGVRLQVAVRLGHHCECLWASLKQGQEFLHVSHTTAGVNGRECLLQIRILLGPRSALQGLTSWPQYASSESFQRLAFPYSLPSRGPPQSGWG